MRIPISLIDDTVYMSFAQLHYGYTPFTNLLTAVVSLIRYFPVSSLGLDYRCWDILAGMPYLREVKMVFETGRNLKGALGFLDIEEWRQGLKEKAERAEKDIRDERRKLSEVKRYADVEVRCVDLTKGGEVT
ncbi:hypothetical protein OCU04_007718 [Sclerotinia nivalis]|uniref:Uncharacterized protein n=1 Tax=Sclerotinia nivalis TaxID=352851 RepID=A0A9X0AKB7_9HELO|nr:hypothetical protein OCU04_007718 [Sclerotinia nivalis]